MAELSRSRDRLTAITGQEIVHFACPWGVAGHDFDPVRDTALARASGYRTFFTTRRGHASGPDDVLLMPRHVIEPHWPQFQLDALMGGTKRGWWSSDPA